VISYKGESYYIAPSEGKFKRSEGDDLYHIVYKKEDLLEEPETFECGVDDEHSIHHRSHAHDEDEGYALAVFFFFFFFFILILFFIFFFFFFFYFFI